TRFVCDDESLRSKPSDPPNADSCSPAQIDVLKQLFGQFLSELEPREKQIVVARFGFDGNPPRTFRELGVEMGVCKERIRQIQGLAMTKLREMASKSKLEQTVDNWL
ncbi:MAG: sigma factor-like helix-turn-helix DNA-binding protein, partial [Planctomycetota bacterium]